MFATVNNIQLHELETAVALFLLSPRLRISLTAGRNGHRTRQERRERRDKNKTDHLAANRRRESADTEVTSPISSGVTGSPPASEHVRTRPSRHEVQKCPIVVHVVVTMYSRFEGFPHLHRPDPVSPGRVPYTKALHAHRRPRVARAPPKRGAVAAYFAYNL